jgi:hypothetical protein
MIASFSATAIAGVAGAGAAAARAESEPAAAPFSAHYTADWRTLNVGTSDIVLRADTTPDHYVYTWTLTARGIFKIIYPDDVIQRSWFSVVNGHVRPERYRSEQGDAKTSIDFDWPAGRVVGESEKKPVDLPLTAGSQDVMSIQIEVMLDLRSGKLPASFRILDKEGFKDFTYTLEGPARIRTALGMLDTLVVASQRPGNSRILRMWFAPSLGFVPVQAERSRDGKLEFAMRVKSLAK